MIILQLADDSSLVLERRKDPHRQGRMHMHMLCWSVPVHSTANSPQMPARCKLHNYGSIPCNSVT